MYADVRWIMEQMEAYAPAALAEDWDNVGLLAGRPEKAVRTVLLALDATDKAVREAVSRGADALVTHHPLIFKPISRVTSETAQGRRLLELIERGVACFCAHTNLDRAAGGVNDALFELLGLRDKEQIGRDAYGLPGQGRAGYLPAPASLRDFAAHVQKTLKLDSIRYCGDSGAVLKKIGICAGGAAGAKYARMAAEAKCDCYVTGDIGYHDAQAIADMGLCAVDATHYAGEAPVLGKLRDYLAGCAERDGLTVDITAADSGAGIA
ncbi:MAG: Nif3-like dinuclear metal center hexameric protein [Firmicutes bacterium]|nr:Nif3-like dinuclear metal center hexameric protein [Bacillota bacterium]